MEEDSGKLQAGKEKIEAKIQDKGRERLQQKEQDIGQEKGQEKGEEKVQKNRIHILDKDTINKIAAGEVIERPASIVKELIDNSIDAGATDIRIEVERGGKTSILIRDNGSGMSKEDALLAYKKHATSKLTRIEDLDNISTMGFRGEALASITAVAKVEILTRPAEEITGTKIVIHGGKVLETSDAGTAPGTSVHVKDLFYNTPARRKYLKSDRTELAHITDTVMRLALANPEISFTLLSGGKTILKNIGSQQAFNSIVNLLGSETARAMLPLEYKTEDFELKGYISKPEKTRGEGDQLYLFVNTRPVTSKIINKAAREGYYTKIPKERYPVAVLSIFLDPREVDVNVHPRKAEVRFIREKELQTAIIAAIEKVLSENTLIPEIKGRESKSRDRENKSFQKSFELSTPSVGIKEMQVSESRETFQKIPPDRDVNTGTGSSGNQSSGQTPVERGIENAGVSETSKIPQNRPETYTYPVKDTERKLKRSERLLDFAEEKQVRIEEKIGPAEEGKKEQQKEGQQEIQKSRQKTNKANTELLEDLRIIGQVSKVYILAEKGEDLIIIDQHAAHERILYEQLLRIKKSRVQELISPVTIDLTPKEKVLMEEYIPYLEEYGFGISEFGDNTYVVTFVPEIFGRLESKEVIHDIVSDLLLSGKVRKDTGISEKVSKILACRAAIKGGAAFSLRQIEELIEQLKMVQVPYSCPHGRPTVISITRGDLDRMFGRTD